MINRLHEEGCKRITTAWDGAHVLSCAIKDIIKEWPFKEAVSMMKDILKLMEHHTELMFNFLWLCKHLGDRKE